MLQQITMNDMALNKLSLTVDNLDKAKEIIQSNIHSFPMEFQNRYKLISDHHWGEKITLANKIIDQLNSNESEQ